MDSLLRSSWQAARRNSGQDGQMGKKDMETGRLAGPGWEGGLGVFAFLSFFWRFTIRRHIHGCVGLFWSISSCLICLP
jgi:hypothetical protein